MIATFTAHAGRAARRTMLVGVALWLMLVGLGFLTVALWIVLASAIGAALTALILGAIYLMLAGAFMLVAVLFQRRAPPPARSAVTGLTIATVIEAFMMGMTAARRKDRK